MGNSHSAGHTVFTSSSGDTDTTKMPEMKERQQFGVKAGFYAVEVKHSYLNTQGSGTCLLSLVLQRQPWSVAAALL